MKIDAGTKKGNEILLRYLKDNHGRESSTMMNEQVKTARVAVMKALRCHEAREPIVHKGLKRLLAGLGGRVRETS